MGGRGDAPLVSIGLPVRNGENFVDDTIASILSQDFEDLELIISDNASTDATPDIAHKWAELDSRVRYMPLQENVGANRNYNRTFRHSRGELFKWAAHDDVLRPGYLTACVGTLQARPEVVLCHSQAELIDRYGDPLMLLHSASVDADGYVEGLPDPKMFYDLTGAADPSLRLRGVLRHITYAVAIFGVIRRSALMHSKLMRDFYGTDKVVLAELALVGPFAQVKEQLWQRRCHPDTSTRNPSPDEQRSWSDPTRRASWYPVDMVRGYGDAIRCADLSDRDRRRAQLELAKKLAEPGKWRQLLVPGPANFCGWGA